MATDGGGEAKRPGAGFSVEIGRLRDLVTTLLDYVDELEAELIQLRASRTSDPGPQRVDTH